MGARHFFLTTNVTPVIMAHSMAVATMYFDKLEF